MQAIAIYVYCAIIAAAQLLAWREIQKQRVAIALLATAAKYRGAIPDDIDRIVSQ